MEEDAIPIGLCHYGFDSVNDICELFVSCECVRLIPTVEWKKERDEITCKIICEAVAKRSCVVIIIIMHTIFQNLDEWEVHLWM